MNPFQPLSHKQQMLMAAGMGIILSVAGFALYHMLQDEPDHPTRIKTKDIKLTPPGKTIDKKDIWMSQMEAQSQQQSQKIDVMQKILEANVQETPSKERGATEQQIKQLQEQMRALQQERRTPGATQGGGASATSQPWTQGGEGGQGQPYAYGPGPVTQTRGVQKLVVNLQNKRSKQRHVSNVLPAGSFAQAVLVGSVDANCGISSTSDPKPVMLRILEQGRLPNNFRSKLKRCVAIGAAHGDLSSERVYVRLERMTCIDKATGEVIETDVAGYVAGEDGKAGIRGEVVDRSGSMLGRAAIGGFFGGISQFMQGNIMNQQLSQLSKESEGHTFFNLDALKQGGIQGVGSALDKLSDYYIKRAEQLQPVIQVGAGRTVDIVFTHGAKIGSQTTKDQVRASSTGADGGQ